DLRGARWGRPNVWPPWWHVPEQRDATIHDIPKALHCNRRRSYFSERQEGGDQAARRCASDRPEAGHGAAARFPITSRRARRARIAATHRPLDQQGYRVASVGALAIPRRTEGGSTARVLVHQCDRFLGP